MTVEEDEDDSGKKDEEPASDGSGESKYSTLIEKVYQEETKGIHATAVIVGITISGALGYDMMNNATSQFSSANLIGKGGCNHVYRGVLPDGTPMAVKVMMPSKEAWKDCAGS
ncbi:hypothetical protein QQ045_014985 [Rhodiola kirilowii]